MVCPAVYAAIAYDGIYAIATQNFWHLHPEELLVLQMILQSVPECSTLAQIPVHLPHTSSEKSWYLMLATLTAGGALPLHVMYASALRVSITDEQCHLSHTQVHNAFVADQHTVTLLQLLHLLCNCHVRQHAF